MPLRVETSVYRFGGGTCQRFRPPTPLPYERSRGVRQASRQRVWCLSSDLIKAAKLWAKVSARAGATYLTGRWGGCRVLVFENLERTSEAEPSHFLFLGEAGEWPVPDQATAPVAAPEPVQEVAELRAVPAAPV